MPTASYLERRGELKTYFDRTAVEAWKRLTSDAPVGRIRATVRAGRDQMRSTLLSWLPADMHGMRLLDAGCGTGSLAVEAARRGANVLAIDLSPTLIDLARERAPQDLGEGRITFAAGDMLHPAHGMFDYIVAMDSLIHYEANDIVRAIAGVAERSRHGVLFTFAPRTPALAAMHFVGRAFPRSDRAPAIEPVSDTKLKSLLGTEPLLRDWSVKREQLISGGFYTSKALELKPA